MTSLRGTITLLIAVTIIILASGCVWASYDRNSSSSHRENQITPIPKVSSPVTTPIYERLRQKILPQPNGSHADYVKMLKDIYDQGEEVKLTIVNDGSDRISCPNFYPDFYVYHLMENGTGIRVRGGDHYVQPMISYIMPGQAFAFQFSTSGLEPGRYQIVIDCGGIYREFLVRTPRTLTPTPAADQ
jgi:hypothetical protein